MRYEHLMPAEFESALAAAPVAYLPWGAMEWHGHHLALGLDGLKAHDLALRIAEKAGGIVFPTVWLGHNTLKVKEHGSFPYTAEFSRTLIQNVLTEYLVNLSDMGFKLIVVLCGHYGPPHVAALYEAVQRFNIFEKRHTVRVWVTPDYELVQDLGYMGDHAAKWETSILWSMRPELVDVSRLTDETAGEGGGILLGDDPRTAAAEVGTRIVAAIVERTAAKVTAFLRNGHD